MTPKLSPDKEREIGNSVLTEIPVVPDEHSENMDISF
jgi:hypothetical protein